MNGKKALESISQTFFTKHAAFGAWILFSIAVFAPMHVVLGVTAAAAAWISSRASLDSQPWEVREFGLIPLNGFFLGLLFSAYFVEGPRSWALLFLGAILIPSFVRSMHFALQGIRLPVLVLPAFSLFLLMALIQPDQLGLGGLTHSGISIRPTWNDPLSFLKLVLQAVGWWVFVPDYRVGALLTVGLLAVRPRLFLSAFLGLSLALILATGLFPSYRAYDLSQLAFSSGVVATGLASLPQKVRPTRIGVAVVFSLLMSAVWVQRGNTSAVPFVSLPYIIAFWGALLSLRPGVRVVDTSPAQSSVVFDRTA